MKRKSKNADWKNYDIVLEALPEDMMSPEEHFENPEDAAFARRELEKGNEWGWCTAHVVVTHKKTGIKGEDYLGGCSYRSKKDFMHPSGYYPDMVNEAIADAKKKNFDNPATRVLLLCVQALNEASDALEKAGDEKTRGLVRSALIEAKSIVGDE